MEGRPVHSPSACAPRMSLRKQMFKKPPPDVEGDYDDGLTVPLPQEETDKYAPGDPMDYFDDVEMLDVSEGVTFRLYRANCESIADEEPATFVLLHGAGCSALSWCLVAKELKEKGCNCLAFDMRGHGGTIFEDGEEDWEKQALCRDIAHVMTRAYSDSSLPKKLVMVGHSMGGALAAFFTQGPEPGDDSAEAASWAEVQRNIAGVVVIDVVEGTAMEALPAMIDIVHNRPSSFPSVEMAIKWFVRTKAIHNLKSARLSVPGMLRQDGDVFVWRSDLLRSEPFWEGWFKGLSKAFVTCRVPKFLILAGTDRLDTELTIAQMQGKYQLLLLPQAGHYIHEDSPTRIANALDMFRGRYVQPKPLNIAKLRRP